MRKGGDHMFFTACRTIEQLKKLYKELAMRWHPDRPSGDLETMQKINAEYDKVFERVKNVHDGKDGVEYTATKGTSETPEMYRDIINQVIHMKGVLIEICGSWIWLTGETYQYHERLSEAGFWWSKSKKAWYWAYDLKSKRKSSRYSMDQIRRTFGSVRIETEEQAAISG